MTDAGDFGGRPSVFNPQGGPGDRIYAGGGAGLPRRTPPPNTPPPPSPPPTSPPPIGSPSLPPARGEFTLEKYARQTRNATCTLAVIAVLGVLAGLICAIIIAAGISKENSQLNNNGGGASSLCQSQGGPLSGC